MLGVTPGVGRRLVWAVASRLLGRRAAAIRAQRTFEALAVQHPRFLIAIPFLKFGGAERVAANLAAALTRLYRPGSVAVVATDWSRLSVGVAFREDATIRTWFPPEVPVLDISAIRAMQRDERTPALMIALMTMRPQMVININSQTMWELYEHFGAKLSKHTRLATVGFVHVPSRNGKTRIGYTATHLAKALRHLDCVITDNVSVINDLRLDLGLSARQTAKFKCLYQYATLPVRLPRHNARWKRRSTNGRRQILWASRVTRGKCPELLPMIARLLPECDIHAYGARELGYRFPAVKSLLFHHDLGHRLAKAPNLFWRGPFKTFNDLPVDRFDALLYTSQYDGLPNILLEAGAAGLPIVAPDVGGIAELVDDTTGWLVRNPLDATEFAERLRDACFGSEALAKAEAMTSRLADRHTFDVFCRAVEALVNESHASAAMRQPLQAPRQTERAQPAALPDGRANGETARLEADAKPSTAINGPGQRLQEAGPATA